MISKKTTEMLPSIVGAAVVGGTGAFVNRQLNAQPANKEVPSTREDVRVVDLETLNKQQRVFLDFFIYAMARTSFKNGGTAGGYWDPGQFKKVTKIDDDTPPDIPSFFNYGPCRPFLFALRGAPLTKVTPMGSPDGSGQVAGYKFERHGEAEEWTDDMVKKFGSSWTVYINQIIKHQLWNENGKVKEYDIVRIYNKHHEPNAEEPKWPTLGCDIRLPLDRVLSKKDTWVIKHGNKITFCYRVGCGIAAAYSAIKAYLSSGKSVADFVKAILNGDWLPNIPVAESDPSLKFFRHSRTVAYKSWLKIFAGIGIGVVCGELLAAVVEFFAKKWDSCGGGQRIRYSAACVGGAAAAVGITLVATGVGSLIVGVALVVGGVIIAWRSYKNYIEHKNYDTLCAPQLA